jgi:hypothetical protein
MNPRPLVLPKLDLWKVREELGRRVLTDEELNALLETGWEDLYRLDAWFASGRPPIEYMHKFNGNLQTQSLLIKLASTRRTRRKWCRRFKWQRRCSTKSLNTHSPIVTRQTKNWLTPRESFTFLCYAPRKETPRCSPSGALAPIPCPTSPDRIKAASCVRC